MKKLSKQKAAGGSKKRRKGACGVFDRGGGAACLVSAFSILTGFGIIKNYTGLFEETTTDAAADTDKGSNYIYNSGISAETSESETSSGESITTGQ